jgi:hypothetical protein
MTIVDSIADKTLRELWTYWSAQRRPDRLPGRDDIDPAAIPALLPFLVLADIVEDGRRIRFRLVGGEIAQRWGNNFTGKYLDEIMTGDYFRFIDGLFRDAIRTGAPVYSEGAFRWDRGKTIGTKRLLLPLARDGKTVDMVLVGQVFTWNNAEIESQKILREADFTETSRVHESGR